MVTNLNILEKKYLHLVSRASPWAAYTMSISLLLLCLYFETAYSHSIYETAGIIIGAWVLWGLIEYIVHRFIFHHKLKNKYLCFFRYLMHGVHHHEPTKTLFVPILIRLSVLLFILLALKLLLDDRMYLFLIGLEIGVIQYITMHYIIHHKKLSRYFPKLTHYHYIHHFVETDTAFGTSSLFWDKVFRTLPSTEHKQTVHKENKHFIS